MPDRVSPQTVVKLPPIRILPSGWTARANTVVGNPPTAGGTRKVGSGSPGPAQLRRAQRKAPARPRIDSVLMVLDRGTRQRASSRPNGSNISVQPAMDYRSRGQLRYRFIPHSTVAGTRTRRIMHRAGAKPMRRSRSGSNLRFATVTPAALMAAMAAPKKQTVTTSRKLPNVRGPCNPGTQRPSVISREIQADKNSIHVAQHHRTNDRARESVGCARSVIGNRCVMEGRGADLFASC